MKKLLLFVFATVIALPAYADNTTQVNKETQLQTVTTTACRSKDAANGESRRESQDGKCVATACYPCFDLTDGKCILKTPENGQWQWESSTETCTLKCDNAKGYHPSDDNQSCVKENEKNKDDNQSVNNTKLSEADAKKRMDELQKNADAMKAKEQSTENKLLGAAGIGGVGIGGMMVASALSERNADQDAEEDMKAYLATFRCDYGQGRNIVGGETNIELPGASDLIQYVTEYKQLAANLKSDKAALGMSPGIESETVFDSATTGLYDDVGTGTQRGAFTSLSRALLDENSADAAEWQAMKDSTANKLKTGAIVAGVSAVGTLAGNLAINSGKSKSNKSDSILNSFKNKKESIPDITLERVSCSKISGTVNNGEYIPNCKCTNANSYFDEHEYKCMPCGTNEHVENNACTCNTGFHYDTNSNCVADAQNQTCATLPANSYTHGTGDYPACACRDPYATFNPVTQKCECNDNYSDPNDSDTCLPLSITNPTPDDNSDDNVTPTKPSTPTDPTQPVAPTTVFAGSFSASNTFDLGAYKISTDKCDEIIEKIKQNTAYDTEISANLYICATGHTDTRYFRKTSGQNANKQKNQKLSEDRAQAVYDCIAGKFNTLFPQARNIQSTPTGKNWQECKVQKPDTTCDDCRKVDVIIRTTPCNNENKFDLTTKLSSI